MSAIVQDAVKGVQDAVKGVQEANVKLNAANERLRVAVEEIPIFGLAAIIPGAAPSVENPKRKANPRGGKPPKKKKTKKKKNKKKKPEWECPICYLSFTNSTVSPVQYCGRGCVICGACKEKMGGDACPLCRDPAVSAVDLRSAYSEYSRVVYDCFGSDSE